jgi:hypothetical protein
MAPPTKASDVVSEATNAAGSDFSKTKKNARFG